MNFKRKEIEFTATSFPEFMDFYDLKSKDEDYVYARLAEIAGLPEGSKVTSGGFDYKDGVYKGTICYE